MSIYVSIGNSDDKLTQRQWANFCLDVESAILNYASRIHGKFFTVPNSAYQSAIFSFEMINGRQHDSLRIALCRLARHFGQDSIAWAEAETEFLTPNMLTSVEVEV